MLLIVALNTITLTFLQYMKLFSCYVLIITLISGVSHSQTMIFSMVERRSGHQHRPLNRSLPNLHIVLFCNWRYAHAMLFSQLSMPLNEYRLNMTHNVHPWMVYGLVYGVECHFQQYFSYIRAVSFFGEGNRSTWRKPPTGRKSLINAIT